MSGVSWNSPAAVPITLVEILPRVIRRGREKRIPRAECHFEETGRSHAEFLKGFRRLAMAIRLLEGVEAEDTSEESLACLKSGSMPWRKAFLPCWNGYQFMRDDE